MVFCTFIDVSVKVIKKHDEYSNVFFFLWGDQAMWFKSIRKTKIYSWLVDEKVLSWSFMCIPSTEWRLTFICQIYIHELIFNSFTYGENYSTALDMINNLMYYISIRLWGQIPSFIGKIFVDH